MRVQRGISATCCCRRRHPFRPSRPSAGCRPARIRPAIRHCFPIRRSRPSRRRCHPTSRISPSTTCRSASPPCRFVRTDHSGPFDWCRPPARPSPRGRAFRHAARCHCRRRLPQRRRYRGFLCPCRTAPTDRSGPTGPTALTGRICRTVRTARPARPARPARTAPAVRSSHPSRSFRSARPTIRRRHRANR